MQIKQFEQAVRHGFAGADGGGAGGRRGGPQPKFKQLGVEAAGRSPRFNRQVIECP